MSKNSGFKNSDPTLYKSLFTTKFFHGLILPSRKTHGFTSDSTPLVCYTSGTSVCDYVIKQQQVLYTRQFLMFFNYTKLSAVSLIWYLSSFKRYKKHRSLNFFPKTQETFIFVELPKNDTKKILRKKCYFFSKSSALTG